MYVNIRVWCNRLLAGRGHVTNTFFKQWFGIVWWQKIDRVHKNYLTPEIWGKYSMALRFFNEVVILTAICWRAYSCPLNNMAMLTKTNFCLYLVKCLIVTPKCAVNATSSFQQFPRSLKCLWSKLFLLFPLGLSLYIIIARWKNKFLEK